MGWVHDADDNKKNAPGRRKAWGRNPSTTWRRARRNQGWWQRQREEGGDQHRGAVIPPRVLPAWHRQYKKNCAHWQEWKKNFGQYNSKYSPQASYIQNNSTLSPTTEIQTTLTPHPPSPPAPAPGGGPSDYPRISTATAAILHMDYRGGHFPASMVTQRYLPCVGQQKKIEQSHKQNFPVMSTLAFFTHQVRHYKGTTQMFTGKTRPGTRNPILP